MNITTRPITCYHNKHSEGKSSTNRYAMAFSDAGERIFNDIATPLINRVADLLTGEERELFIERTRVQTSGDGAVIHPSDSTYKFNTETINELSRQFTSKNICREILDDLVNITRDIVLYPQDIEGMSDEETEEEGAGLARFLEGSSLTSALQISDSLIPGSISSTMTSLLICVFSTRGEYFRRDFSV